ncbi:MAG: HEAT repeat domain-containing protein [Planctomycetes bacterium]|nr:HEAT repeat domain-containing protein [Planctomycetota bacterium]
MIRSITSAVAALCPLISGCVKVDSGTDGGKGGVEINLPGMHVKTGENGTDITMPGMRIKEGPDGSDITMPGMRIKEGPDGAEVDLRLPNVSVKNGVDGENIDIQFPNVEVNDGQNARGKGPGIRVKKNGDTQFDLPFPKVRVEEGQKDVEVEFPGLKIEVRNRKPEIRTDQPEPHDVRPMPALKPARDLDPLIEKLKSRKDFDSTVAASRLLRMEIDPSRRREIAAALAGALPDAQFTASVVIARALGRWGTPDEVPVLAKRLETGALGERHAFIDALAAIGDDSAIAPLAARLTEFSDRAKAADVLKQFGAKAEDAALRYLKPDDWQTCRVVCQLLAQIGTEKSLAALQPLTETRRVGRDAQKAIAAIKNRLNK